jgi:hypothetical protein
VVGVGHHHNSPVLVCNGAAHVYNLSRLSAALDAPTARIDAPASLAASGAPVAATTTPAAALVAAAAVASSSSCCCCCFLLLPLSPPIRFVPNASNGLYWWQPVQNCELEVIARAS